MRLNTLLHNGEGVLYYTYTTWALLGRMVFNLNKLISFSRSGIGVYKTCNNDKNLSEIQLKHEKEDELVAVVVKTLGGSGGESFWEEGGDFGVDFLCFHICLTGILGFLEKLEWWFEEDIDDEGEEDEESEGGSEV
ncbi:hypothetical protein Tco_1227362 [Tanacetum coccineum]